VGFSVLVIAHRGASAVEAENTVAAFEAAVAQGADGVELDVRRTADGAMAVCHDAALADGRLVVDLQRRDLPPEVCDLATALDACRPLPLVNVEIKNWPDDADFDADARLADQVVELVASRGERERVLVSCFHLATVDRVHALDPDLPTAWLTYQAVDVFRALDTAADHGHRALHPHHSFVSPELVDAAHAAGLALNTWTCDDPERIRWLASIGVDGVVTNDPALARRALAIA
jgi:glycerophosphoryl diester phosphodiesterase